MHPLLGAQKKSHKTCGGPAKRRDTAPLLVVYLGEEAWFQRFPQVKLNLRKKGSHHLLVKAAAKQFRTTHQNLKHTVHTPLTKATARRGGHFSHRHTYTGRVPGKRRAAVIPFVYSSEKNGRQSKRPPTGVIPQTAVFMTRTTPRSIKSKVNPADRQERRSLMDYKERVFDLA